MIEMSFFNLKIAVFIFKDDRDLQMMIYILVLK
jgi:hypothetical protein